jgi:hypothetical protein
MDEIKIQLNYINTPKIIKSLKMEGHGLVFPAGKTTSRK